MVIKMGEPVSSHDMVACHAETMRPDPNAPVVVAVDSFKGSLSSGKACRAVRRGFLRLIRIVRSSRSRLLMAGRGLLRQF